jgi:hypothetical protein
VKTIILPFLTVALLAGSLLECFAKDDAPVLVAGNKPVAIISFASYDRLMTDLAFLGDLAGSPDLDKNIDGAIQLFTQGQGLNGMDKTRPFGLILATDGAQFQPLVVLPVNNLKLLLESLAGLVGEAADIGDGVLELNVFDQKIVVKEKNGWAFMGMAPEALVDLPKDPGKLFGGLDKSYDLAARLYMQNLPEVYRSLLVDQLRGGVEAGLARQGDETDEAFAARKKLVTDQIDSLSKSVNEVDQLTVGLALDAKAKSGRVDLSIAAVPGSESAKLMGQIQSSASSFAGFLLPDAAAAMNISAKVGKDAMSQIAPALQSFRAQAAERIDAEARLPDPAAKKLAKEMVGEVLDAIQATLETGKIDAGAALTLGDKTMAVVAGAYVAEPSKLEDALKKFAKLMEGEDDFPGIKFNAETYNGVRFHTTKIPVPQDDPVAKVLGDKLDVAVGIGPKSVYLALGTDSIKLCKSVIDKSKADASKPVPPLQVNVALAPIFRFAAAMQDQPTITAMAEELAKSNGKDKVRLTVTPDGLVTTIRIEAQEGVLKMLGAAFMASGGLTGLAPGN